MTYEQPPAPPIQHRIHVTVASPEEASLGVAEFWASGEDRVHAHRGR